MTNIVDIEVRQGAKWLATFTFTLKDGKYGPIIQNIRKVTNRSLPGTPERNIQITDCLDEPVTLAQVPPKVINRLIKEIER